MHMRIGSIVYYVFKSSRLKEGYAFTIITNRPVQQSLIQACFLGGLAPTIPTLSTALATLAASPVAPVTPGPKPA